MIQELRIKNFLSFKDEVTFSFEATKDKKFDESQLVEVSKGVRLLRFAVVYGANASGKSNLLMAFDFLMKFVGYEPDDDKEETSIIPFMLDNETPNQPSEFNLIFYVDEIKYWYVLIADKHRVHSEKLYYYTTHQPTMLFERELQNNVSVVSFNPKAIKVSSVAKEEINVKCLPNMSVFAARSKVNISIPEIDKAKDWLFSSFLQPINPKTNLFGFAERSILKNDELKNYLLDFVRKADFNISEIITSSEKEPIPDKFIEVLLQNDKISEDEKDRIKIEKSFQKITTVFNHIVKLNNQQKTFSLPFGLQSSGTHRVMGIEAAIYKQLKKNAILFIDELEASLHPDLMEYIIQMFLQQKNNRSQLLVTTHYDPLLNLADDLFRKDCVWFTEKQEDGHTNLYSLVDFKGLNRISSLQKAYRNGLFGAIPNIKE